MPAVPRLFAGRYERQVVLGRGGYGVVWQARDHNLGRDVALKLFARGSGITFPVREARVLTALESPHILRVFNADEYQDVPFLATEIASLRATDDQIAGIGVAPRLAVRWVRHLLVGLEFCHANQLIHRDIKPANLFLQSEELAQLGDFGVAAIANPAGFVAAQGDFRIRAPEMYSLGAGTASSDLYSVGVTLFVLLSGVFPFDGTPAEIEQAAVHGNPPDIRDLAPHISLQLAQRVRKSMAKDPADRYTTTREMHQALGGITPRDRSWARVPTHPGHDRCWESAADEGRLGVAVCVTSTPSGFEIETRRNAGARSRLRAFCGTAGNESRLRVFLRDLFQRA
jgi:serine/threonine-protein kinase